MNDDGKRFVVVMIDCSLHCFVAERKNPKPAFAGTRRRRSVAGSLNGRKAIDLEFLLSFFRYHCLI